MTDPIERPTPEGSGVAPAELRRRTARGAVVVTAVQAVTLVLRLGSMMLLARLLLREDFGLFSMVTAFTGILSVLRDAGLSMVAVQRDSVTSAEMSALFWLSAGLGWLLAAATACAAPVLVAFYGEPRLFWVTVALGTTFALNGLSIQHRALLQRRLRIAWLALVDVASLVLSVTVGVGMAWAGYGYWSLVVMALAQPAAGAIGVWLAAPWRPGRPALPSSVRGMIGFGGAVTLNNVTMYLATNIDKALVGRVFGADALGVYSRAYQLISIPTENLNAVMGSVAFPALARLQGDPARQRAYFLLGYRMLLSLAVPLTAACAVFAVDIVVVFLGSRWQDVGPVFRLLAPTVLAFALINPFGWLLYASGHARRNLYLAFLIAPVVVLGYSVGVWFGPAGVALGYSAAMALLVLPVIEWARHGTPMSLRDVIGAAGPAIGAAAIATAAALALQPTFDPLGPALLRLAVESAVFLGVYLAILLAGMQQGSIYLRLCRETGLWPLKNLATDASS